jgi:rhodanese-related sulfurtransferase
VGGIVVALLVAVVALVVWNRRAIAFAVIERITERKFPTVQPLAADDLARWRADSTRAQPVLLDARSGPEFGLSHLRGATRIDPREPGLKALAAFPRDTPIVVYSRVGYRSARVALWLQRHGFRTVFDLADGIFAWANEQRPMEAAGRPATQVHPYSTTWGRLLKPDVRADAPPVADPLSLP